MTGFCSSCRERGLVARYRMAGVGLRYLHADCAARLQAMGMHCEPVTDGDPRTADRGRLVLGAR